ncbi:MAG: 8-amino-7-oxononanoate synthase [Nitrospira sp.]|nr:8-amino-7-oxononanoate synthase [Nitrospira sp.]
MFQQRLNDLAQQSLLRQLRTIASASGPEVTLAGRPVILMASNDYLGLAAHPALKQAAIDATERFGVGAGAARLISGTLPPHTELEAALAKFKGTEAALTFGSGYLANLGVIPALIETGGLILADRLCHASLVDGCRLSSADFRVYRHNDMAHLKSLLARRTAQRRTLIVTDGVFSMDGDLAPLPQLVELAGHYGAQLYIDDAHGTGVMGAHGRGTPEHFNLESRVPFHMGTLGKALGTGGAYIVGSSATIQYLLNTARTFLFATALPPATAAATVAALRLVQQEPERRARLWENRRYLHGGLTTLGFRIADSASPILPIVIGDTEKTVAMAERLLALDVYAPAIRPPTVPKGTSRIRVTVTSAHSHTQMDRVLGAFRTAGEALRLI